MSLLKRESSRKLLPMLVDTSADNASAPSSKSGGGAGSATPRGLGAFRRQDSKRSQVSERSGGRDSEPDSAPESISASQRMPGGAGAAAAAAGPASVRSGGSGRSKASMPSDGLIFTGTWMGVPHEGDCSGRVEVSVRDGEWWLTLKGFRVISVPPENRPGTFLYFCPKRNARYKVKVSRCVRVPFDGLNELGSIPVEPTAPAADFQLNLGLVMDERRGGKQVDPRRFESVIIAKAGIEQEDGSELQPTIVYGFANIAPAGSTREEAAAEAAERIRRQSLALADFGKEAMAPVSLYGRTYEEMDVIARDCFATLGKTKIDGSLSFSEFKMVLVTLNVPFTEARAYTWFDVADADGSGEIEFEEFQHLLYIVSKCKPAHYLALRDVYFFFTRDRSGEEEQDEGGERMPSELPPVDSLALHAILNSFESIKMSQKKVDKLLKLTNVRTGKTVLTYEQTLDVWLGLIDPRAELNKRSISISKLVAEKKVDGSDKGSLRTYLRALILQEDEELVHDIREALITAENAQKAMRIRKEERRKERVAVRERDDKQVKRAKALMDREERMRLAREREAVEERKRMEESLKAQMEAAVAMRSAAEGGVVKVVTESSSKEDEERRVRLGLDRLELSGRGIQYLPKVMWTTAEGRKRLSELVIMDLSSNMLQAIPGIQVLYHCSSLQKLDLSGNALRELPTEIGDLQHLLILALNNNSLASLPPTIGKLSNLQRLTLHSNELTELPDTLDGLKSVSLLTLQANRLTALPKSIGGCTALTDLNLAANRIEFLPEALSKCSSLVRLDLRSNGLRDLPVTLGGLKKLTHLYISHNRIRDLPPSIGKCKRLRVFDAARNSIKVLPDSFGKLGRLLSVDLQENEIRVLPPASLEGLVSVQRFDVSHNRLLQLPPSMGRMVDLQTLNCAHNKLRLIPHDIAACRLLRHWNLRFNALGLSGAGGLPPSVGTMASLEWIDLSSNSISAVAPELSKCPKLKHVNLSFNKMKELPAAFAGMPALVTLDLSNNELTYIAPEVGACTSLRALDLSCNKLVRIPDSIAECASLRHLHLYNNRIAILPFSMAWLFPQLVSFDIAKNPLAELPQKWAASEVFGASEVLALRFARERREPLVVEIRKARARELYRRLMNIKAAYEDRLDHERMCMLAEDTRLLKRGPVDVVKEMSTFNARKGWSRAAAGQERDQLMEWLDFIKQELQLDAHDAAAAAAAVKRAAAAREELEIAEMTASRGGPLVDSSIRFEAEATARAVTADEEERGKLEQTEMAKEVAKRRLTGKVYKAPLRLPSRQELARRARTHSRSSSSNRPGTHGSHLPLTDGQIENFSAVLSRAVPVYGTDEQYEAAMARKAAIALEKAQAAADAEAAAAEAAEAQAAADEHGDQAAAAASSCRASADTAGSAAAPPASAPYSSLPPRYPSTTATANATAAAGQQQSQRDGSLPPGGGSSSAEVSDAAMSGDETPWTQRHQASEYGSDSDGAAASGGEGTGRREASLSPEPESSSPQPYGAMPEHIFSVVAPDSVLEAGGSQLDAASFPPNAQRRRGRDRNPRFLRNTAGQFKTLRDMQAHMAQQSAQLAGLRDTKGLTRGTIFSSKVSVDHSASPEHKQSVSMQSPAAAVSGTVASPSSVGSSPSRGHELAELHAYDKYVPEKEEVSLVERTAEVLLGHGAIDSGVAHYEGEGWEDNLVKRAVAANPLPFTSSRRSMSPGGGHHRSTLSHDSAGSDGGQHSAEEDREGGLSGSNSLHKASTDSAHSLVKASPSKHEKQPGRKVASSASTALAAPQPEDELDREWAARMEARHATDVGAKAGAAGVAAAGRGRAAVRPMGAAASVAAAAHSSTKPSHRRRSSGAEAEGKDGTAEAVAIAMLPAVLRPAMDLPAASPDHAAEADAGAGAGAGGGQQVAATTGDLDLSDSDSGDDESKSNEDGGSAEYSGEGSSLVVSEGGGAASGTSQPRKYLREDGTMGIDRRTRKERREERAAVRAARAAEVAEQQLVDRYVRAAAEGLDLSEDADFMEQLDIAARQAAAAGNRGTRGATVVPARLSHEEEMHAAELEALKRRLHAAVTGEGVQYEGARLRALALGVDKALQPGGAQSGSSATDINEEVVDHSLARVVNKHDALPLGVVQPEHEALQHLQEAMDAEDENQVHIVGALTGHNVRRLKLMAKHLEQRADTFTHDHARAEIEAQFEARRAVRDKEAKAKQEAATREQAQRVVEAEIAASDKIDADARALGGAAHGQDVLPGYRDDGLSTDIRARTTGITDYSASKEATNAYDSLLKSGVLLKLAVKKANAAATEALQREARIEAVREAEAAAQSQLAATAMPPMPTKADATLPPVSENAAADDGDFATSTAKLLFERAKATAAAKKAAKQAESLKRPYDPRRDPAMVIRQDSFEQDFATLSAPAYGIRKLVPEFEQGITKGLWSGDPYARPTAVKGKVIVPHAQAAELKSLAEADSKAGGGVAATIGTVLTVPEPTEVTGISLAPSRRGEDPPAAESVRERRALHEKRLLEGSEQVRLYKYMGGVKMVDDDTEAAASAAVQETGGGGALTLMHTGGSAGISSSGGGSSTHFVPGPSDISTNGLARPSSPIQLPPVSVRPGSATTRPRSATLALANSGAAAAAAASGGAGGYVTTQLSASGALVTSDGHLVHQAPAMPVATLRQTNPFKTISDVPPAMLLARDQQMQVLLDRGDHNRAPRPDETFAASSFTRGYTSGDVAEFLRLESTYASYAEAEWYARAGAYLEGRSGIQDFIKAVRRRMQGKDPLSADADADESTAGVMRGDAWNPVLVPLIRRFYSTCYRTGLPPMYGSLSPEQIGKRKEMEELVKAHRSSMHQRIRSTMDEQWADYEQLFVVDPETLAQRKAAQDARAKEMFRQRMFGGLVDLQLEARDRVIGQHARAKTREALEKSKAGAEAEALRAQVAAKLKYKEEREAAKLREQGLNPQVAMAKRARHMRLAAKMLHAPAEDE